MGNLMISTQVTVDGVMTVLIRSFELSSAKVFAKRALDQAQVSAPQRSGVG